MRAPGQLAFEQIPILKVGETMISQSCAIARYAQTDMVVDAWRDILDIFYGCYALNYVNNFYEN